MKTLIIIAILLLSACSHTTTLKHPETGLTASCESGVGRHSSAMREEFCIKDWQSKGYERTP